ncbi:aspartate carbamoyltransferase catalytic subunit [Litorimonas sp. RW-G-Af-16]|uniref:aspartate carbamoyltransferase catalytic subunit n=1 Tax=Litorimonas sp. RW-G-Af-16 TaxID=3241168 RepID=UPI00390C9CEA
MSYSRAIIDDIFGGIRPASRALDKAASTIQGWYDTGTIPQKHWPDVIEIAEQFGHTLTSDDFFPDESESASEPLLSSYGYPFAQRHCLSVTDYKRPDIDTLLSLGAHYLDLNIQKSPTRNVLSGKTLINLFFENSTRTEKSFELAGKRLGADVINMAISQSSVAKGETLLDTAATLNAMNPDLLVVRHNASGAPHLLAQKVSCSVINAGDGMHSHPTQALLDALTLHQAFDGDIAGLRIAICGDITHSRVARSNIQLLNMLGAEVRLIGPPTLIPIDADRWGVDVFHDMEKGLKGCDVVMMLRLQLERMSGAFVPSKREYFHYYGLDRAKLAFAKDSALVMHPGPMNRGVEISSDVADDPDISLITQQVETGVAMRMAILHALSHAQDTARRNP